jgi:hypothetical protein
MLRQCKLQGKFLQAVDDLYYLERACEVVVKAKSMGEPLNVISDKAAKAFMDDFRECGMVSHPSRAWTWVYRV